MSAAELLKVLRGAISEQMMDFFSSILTRNMEQFQPLGLVHGAEIILLTKYQWLARHTGDLFQPFFALN
jgi:hypothetical protein